MVPVKLIMTPREKIKVIDRDETVRKAAGLMQNHGIGSLLVVKGEDVIGIVTDRDLVRRAMAAGLDSDQTAIEKIMSAPFLQIDENASLLDANDLMAKQKVRHLGVEKSGKLTGLVSVSDLLSFLAKYPRG